MAVSFFIRNKKAKIATLFARIRSKAKDIDIKASTLLEVDVAVSGISNKKKELQK